MKTIEDARPVFFALGQKTLALCFLWCCGDEDEMEDFAPLRLSAELVFCAVGFLLFLEAGEVRVLFGMGFLRTQSKSSLPLAVWSRNGLFVFSQP
jgi:hypothetical protein